MNNEKLQEILRVLLKRLDLVTIGLLIVIGVTISYLVMVREGNTQIETVEKPPPAPLVDKFKDNTVLLRLERFFPDAPPPLAEDPKLRVVVQNDMFSVKALGEGGNREGARQ